MRPFHPLLRYATKETRESGRLISPTNILKVSVFGDNIAVYDLAPPDQPNTYMIVVFNGRYMNTYKLDHNMISDMHTKHILQQVRKGISILTEAIQRANKKIKVDPEK